MAWLQRNARVFPAREAVFDGSARWGEVPVAFVLPKEGRSLSEAAGIEFCRERLAHFE